MTLHPYTFEQLPRPGGRLCRFCPLKILNLIGRALAVSVVASATVLQPAQSQQQLRNGPGGEPPLEIPMIQGTITLDGRPDEAAWENAALVKGTMFLPDPGADPSQDTDFLIAHDGEYLYFACRAYETDPSQIRVTTLARDVSAYSTDSCGIRIDSFNDEENAIMFVTTPASVRTDWAFANDASGMPNQDWNTFWDAEGTVTDYGWSAEIRVPFSSMSFQSVDGQVVMGFAVARSIVRNNETVVHPAIPPNWGPSSIAKPSQMRKMIFHGVEPTRPIYLTPYALTGTGFVNSLNTPRDAYVRDDNRVFEVGGDLRYGLTRNLNLDVTVNTDFAQVESDNLQVNLTRFSLFFPEKRRFFQERAAIFEFPLGFRERLFHSRRIGLVNGEPVTLYGGARMVGRVGDWDVGMIDMQTGGVEAAMAGRADLPSENMGVLRLRRRVLNQFSTAGGIFTSRIGDDGSYNVLYGNDAVLRLFGQDYLTLNWAQSFEEDSPLPPGAQPLPEADDIGFFERSLARLNWQRRGNDGLTYTVDVTRAGRVFEPGLGFLLRRDYTAGSTSIGYGWRPQGQGAALNRYAISFNGNGYRRNAEESIESAAFGIRGDMELRTGHSFNLDVNRNYEDLTRPFPISASAVVPVGSYWFNDVSLNFNPPSGAIIRPRINIAGGQFYDGSRISGSISPSWSASRNVTLGGEYQLDRIRFDERDQSFTSHIGRFRGDFTFTTRTSASAFVQYNSTGDVVVSNLRFRYNPTEGRDLYIVWNEVVNSDRYALNPVAPFTQQRSILIKYVHTFTLGV